MKHYILILLLLFTCYAGIHAQPIDLTHEYSMEEFQRGIRSYHDCEYEIAISYFIKSLGYDADNHLARYFLGDAYRKAGYEKNAIFVWNNLLALGYKERSLKNKISYLYNKRGMLNEININKNYIIKEDITGYYDETTLPLFIKPSQIFVDTNNHAYIASFLTGGVLEIDSNYRVVKNHFPLVTKLLKPFGVVLDKNGNIYVSDFENDYIMKFNKLGAGEKKIGFKGVGNGALLGPEYLLLDDEENLYVVDSGNKRINKYRLNGDFLFSFGNSDEYRLEKPAGMLFYDNNIYICDRKKNEVAVFDKHGNYLNSFGDDKLSSPYDITRDRFNRFLILCEDTIWAYENENALWYVIDAPGQRLKRGISIAMDKENNLLVTDYNTSRLLVFSHERERYTNLNINIERIFSYKFPDVHIALNVEKDDFTIPSGITSSNVTIFENGKLVPAVGSSYTRNRDKNCDILIIYDKNEGMKKHTEDVKLIMNTWLKNRSANMNVGLVTISGRDAVIEHNFNAGRLSMLESINEKNYSTFTDKGTAIKYSIYHMLKRFSKKTLIIVTNGQETGNDFENFKLENCISLARNNDVSIYVVAFDDGKLRDLYKYIADKSGGEYYDVYKRSDLKDLLHEIERNKGREVILSYRSRSLSRFGEEPIAVTVQVDYSGMTGIGKSLYYPAQYKIEQ